VLEPESNVKAVASRGIASRRVDESKRGVGERCVYKGQKRMGRGSVSVREWNGWSSRVNKRHCCD